MHFVYPYVHDYENGAELRYSLRGLEKHYMDDEIVPIIVGDLPDWANVNLRWIRTEQTKGDPAYRLANVLRGVHLAMSMLSAEGVQQAVVLDDDHILLDHTATIPACWVSSWSDQMRQVRAFEAEKEWLRSGFHATNDHLREVSGARSFEVHRPMPVNTGQLALMLSPHVGDVPAHMPLWRSLWGNLGVDQSLTRQARDVRAVDAFPRGTAWVSTDEKYGWSRMERHVRSILPTRSKWER